ncbi:hypothetical protein [Nibrella saemangeumensis]
MWWDTFLLFTLYLAACTVFFIFFNKLSKSVKLIGYAVLAGFLINLSAVCLIYIFNFKNNLFLFHLLTLLQYLLFSMSYFYHLNNFNIRKFILISVPFFVISSIILSLFVEPLNEYNSYSVSLSNLLIGFITLFYFIEIFLKPNIKRIEFEPMFWISSGLLFVSFGNFLVQGFMNYLIKNAGDYALQVYWIHEFLNFLFLITFIIGIMSQYVNVSNNGFETL